MTKLRAWLFVIAIPVVAFVVALAVQAHYSSELRSAARKQFPDADESRIADLSVTRLCDLDPNSLPELCAANNTQAFLRSAASMTVIAGAILLIGITISGFIARTHRAVLLSLFKPGLYLTAAMITGLIVAHALLAMAAIYYLESEFVGRVHFGIILAIGLGALGGVVAVSKNAFRVVQKAEIVAVGRSVTRKQAPGLWRSVEQTASRLGSLKPDQIVIGMDPSFYVTEADVVCLDGRLSGRTLFCSLPLSRILKKDELTAILGHELGHFRGEDTKYSERFYPIYRGTVDSLQSLANAGGQGAGVLALIPAMAFFGYFLDAFAVAENEHSRVRELLADSAGAQATSANSMAVALVKVHAFAGVWNELQRAAVKAMQDGKVFINASVTYSQAIAERGKPEALKGIADTHTSHPTDSHPPLGVRLQSLGIPLHSIVRPSLEVSPDDPAVTLVDDYEMAEENLSEAYQQWLAHQVGIQLPDAPPQEEVVAG